MAAPGAAPPTDLIIGGWKTSGIWRIADGRPLAFTVAVGTLRPNIVGTPKRNHGSDWVDNYLLGGQLPYG
jgi:hypothetical protein